MTTLALSWPAGGHINVAELKEGRRVIVGRSHEAAVVIDDPTVSRQHVSIFPGSPAHTVEHLSSTNPTRLNGAPVEASAALSDGDVLTIGTVAVTFHDLAARDRRSGPVCHVCRRENDPADHDCWFCGTSLLNAPTTIREPRPVICRVLAAGTPAADLYAGRALVLNLDGTIEAMPMRRTPADASRVEEREGVPFHVPAGNSRAQELNTGTRVVVGSAVFSVICRPGRAA